MMNYEELIELIKKLQAEGKIPAKPTEEQRQSWAKGQVAAMGGKVRCVPLKDT